MNINSVPFRLCLHLVQNPGAAMFSDQLTKMYDLSRPEVHMRLRTAVRTGWVAKNWDQNRVYYSAGPKLEEAMK